MAAYWRRWREKNQPYVEKTCVCGANFFPHSGPQKRCDKCRTLICKQCGGEFIPQEARMSQMFCCKECDNASRKGKVPAQLEGKRGTKPRTYHLRHRDKHGSAEDREWRTSVFERDHYTCQDCGQIGGRLQAHHIEAFKARPDLRHELSNGLTLCIPCHKKTDTYGWQNYWKNEIAAKRLSQEVFDFTPEMESKVSK